MNATTNTDTLPTGRTATRKQQRRFEGTQESAQPKRNAKRAKLTHVSRANKAMRVLDYLDYV